MKNLLKTDYTDYGLLLVRVWVGIAMIWHSFPVIFQSGMDGFIGYIDSLGIPFPSILARVAKITEFVCGSMVMVGFYTKIAAILLSINMLVALGVGHRMIILGEGELAMNYLTIGICLALSGGGKFSLNRNKVNSVTNFG